MRTPADRLDPLEKSLERYFFLQVRALGGIAIKVVPIMSGPPDRLVLLEGKTYLVELKTPTGKVSPIQRVWHERAEKVGVPVYVLYGKAGIKSWLRAAVDGVGKRPGRKRADGSSAPNPLLSRRVWDGTECLPGDDCE